MSAPDLFTIVESDTNHPVSGIYRIRNAVTGREYIGQSKDVRGRWRSHRRDLKNKAHCSTLMQHDHDTHGEDSFTVDMVEVHPTDFRLDDHEMRKKLKARRLLREQEVIDAVNPAYNSQVNLIAIGGRATQAANKLAVWLI